MHNQFYFFGLFDLISAFPAMGSNIHLKV